MHAWRGTGYSRCRGTRPRRGRSRRTGRQSATRRWLTCATVGRSVPATFRGHHQRKTPCRGSRRSQARQALNQPTHRAGGHGKDTRSGYHECLSRHGTAQYNVARYARAPWAPVAARHGWTCRPTRPHCCFVTRHEPLRRHAAGARRAVCRRPVARWPRSPRAGRGGGRAGGCARGPVPGRERDRWRVCVACGIVHVAVRQGTLPPGSMAGSGPVLQRPRGAERAGRRPIRAGRADGSVDRGGSSAGDVGRGRRPGGKTRWLGGLPVLRSLRPEDRATSAGDAGHQGPIRAPEACPGRNGAVTVGPGSSRGLDRLWPPAGSHRKRAWPACVEVLTANRSMGCTIGGSTDPRLPDPRLQLPR